MVDEQKGSPSPPTTAVPAAVLQKGDQKWAGVIQRYQAHEPVTKKELKRIVPRGDTVDVD